MRLRYVGAPFTSVGVYIQEHARANDPDLWPVRASAGRWIYYGLLSVISSRNDAAAFDLVTESVRNDQEWEREREMEGEE